MVSAIPDTETCQNTERHELQLRSGVLLRPHRSTTYVDVAYCYRPSSVVCWSVCLSDCRSVSYTSEPSKNSWTDRDAVWVMDLGGPREPCIRWGPDPPMGRGNFEGERVSIVKYRDTLRSSVQKQLNRTRCRLACGLGWAQGIMC